MAAPAAGVGGTAPWASMTTTPGWASLARDRSRTEQPASSTTSGSAATNGSGSSSKRWAAAQGPSVALGRFPQRAHALAPHAPLASLSNLHLPHLGGKPKLNDMNGTWVKDKARSQSMETAMNIMHLGGIMRQAVKFVRGVRIDQDQTNFTLTVFSIFAWFKVRETYPFSGETAQYKRRDFRRGKHTGYVEQHGKDLRLHLTWDEPLGGVGTDEFLLVAQDELHIKSHLEVAGQRADYVTVYRRKT